MIPDELPKPQPLSKTNLEQTASSAGDQTLSKEEGLATELFASLNGHLSATKEFSGEQLLSWLSIFDEDCQKVHTFCQKLLKNEVSASTESLTQLTAPLMQMAARLESIYKQQSPKEVGNVLEKLRREISEVDETILLKSYFDYQENFQADPEAVDIDEAMKGLKGYHFQQLGPNDWQEMEHRPPSWNLNNLKNITVAGLYCLGTLGKNILLSTIAEPKADGLNTSLQPAHKIEPIDKAALPEPAAKTEAVIHVHGPSKALKQEVALAESAPHETQHVGSTSSIPSRIKVDPRTMGSEAFRSFVGNNEPEMSNDPVKTAALVKNIHEANYTPEILSDPELPYLALAGFYNGQLSVWDVSNLCIWHQLGIDYPDSGLTILPLFDAGGNWTKHALDEITRMVQNDAIRDSDKKSLSDDEMEKLRIALRQLPLSQQVFHTFKGWKKPYRPDFIRPELSLDGRRILLNIEHGRHFAFEPRLGPFTKNDIVTMEVDHRCRLGNIPFPGIEFEKILNKKLVTPSNFAAHDRFHRLLLHKYSTVDAILEILAGFKRMTGEEMSREIWELGDFDFNNVNSPAQGPNKEFNTVIGSMISKLSDVRRFPPFYKDLKEHAESSLLGWGIVLHIRANREQWQKHGLSVDELPFLNYMNELVEESEPYLQNYSILQQIYLLQKLASSGMTADKFFASPPEVPRLTIEHIKPAEGAGDQLRLKVKLE